LLHKFAVYQPSREPFLSFGSIIQVPELMYDWIWGLIHRYGWQSLLILFKIYCVLR